MTKLKNAATLSVLFLIIVGVGRLVLATIETSAQNKLLWEQEQARQVEYNKLLTTASLSLAQYFDLRFKLSEEQNTSKKMVIDVYNRNKDNKDWGDCPVPSDFVRLL